MREQINIISGCICGHLALYHKIAWSSSSPEESAGGCEAENCSCERFRTEDTAFSDFKQKVVALTVLCNDQIDEDTIGLLDKSAQDVLTVYQDLATAVEEKRRTASPFEIEAVELAQNILKYPVEWKVIENQYRLVQELISTDAA